MLFDGFDCDTYNFCSDCVSLEWAYSRFQFFYGTGRVKIGFQLVFFWRLSNFCFSSNMKFRSLRLRYVDRWETSESAISQCPTWLWCSGKNFVINWLYCLQKAVLIHRRRTLFYKLPLLNDFDQLFLVKFTTFLPFLVHTLLCMWRFSRSTWGQVKNILCTLWLLTFSEVWVKLGGAEISI